MSRITNCLARCQAEGRSALIPYLTAGDPQPESTVSFMHALVRGGADIIELGLPFSDPMADGPTIQLACERSLAAGTTTAKVLQMVCQFREDDPDTPLVLMGYLNPMLRHGAEEFARLVKEAGADGVLAVDLAVEEAESLQPALKAEGLDTVFLIAPTTSQERAAKMSQLGGGYVYYVSLKGVTGSAALDVQAVQEKLTELRKVVTLPIAVGFGIRTAEQVAQVSEHAEGIIVGSALVERIARSADQVEALPDILQTAVSELHSGIKKGTVK